MTTDAAAPEIVATPETVAPAADAGFQSTPAGELTDSASTETSATTEEATGSPAASFDVTSLPEYQEAVKTPAPEAVEAAAAPQMPGEPVEQVQSRLEVERTNRMRAFMQMSDTEARDWMTQQLGLLPQDAHQLWHSKLGPWFRALVNDNAVYNKNLFHEAVDNELPPEGQQAYYSSVYPNQAKALKGVFTAGEAVERAKWETRVKNGEFLTPAQVKKIGEAAYARGLGGAEQNGEIEGASSGQELQGVPSNPASEDAILLDPNADMKVVTKILDRRLGR